MGTSYDVDKFGAYYWITKTGTPPLEVGIAKCIKEEHANKIMNALNACEGINPEAVPDMYEWLCTMCTECHKKGGHIGDEMEPVGCRGCGLAEILAKAKELSP